MGLKSAKTCKGLTARRVCIAQTMPSQDVRLSVRHTPVLCLNGYTIISSKFFHYRVAPPFQFLPNQTGRQYSDGDPPSAASNARGYEKLISSFISQLMQDRAIVTMESEYEIAPKFLNGTGLIHLE